MKNNHKKEHRGNSIFSSISNFLTKGWETIHSPSKARTDAYAGQASIAQEEMRKEGISRKERKYWSKQNDKAMNGLAAVHETNGDIFVKAICAIGAGLLIGNKLLNSKQQ